MVNRKNVFEKEIETIKDKNLRKFAKVLVENADDYFFEIPASSTGKHHPEYTNIVGGLLLHTKAVLAIVNEILQTKLFLVNDREEDLLRIAALAHDIKKNGDGKTRYTVKNHPYLATLFITDVYKKHKKLLSDDDVKYINDAVEKHMGKWGDKMPSNDSEKILHVADVLASRKNIEVVFDTEDVNKTVPSLNEYVIDFGMHSGKHLNEIPRDYLEWGIKNVKKSTFVSMAKRYLKEQEKKPK